MSNRPRAGVINENMSEGRGTEKNIDFYAPLCATRYCAMKLKVNFAQKQNRLP